jgi:hypothetical protein
MPNDVTIGDWIVDRALPAILQKQMPKMLAAPSDERVIDAEVTN